MLPANGFALVCERLEQLPHLLAGQLSAPYPSLPPDEARRIRERGVWATGAGSSEAAARLLVQRLQRAGIPAAFHPLSRFYSTPAPLPDPAPYLAVFSQGLSPNAGIPLYHRQLFSGLILFTAATPEGQRAAGKTDRADLLSSLDHENALILTHPLENEYTLLPRFIGPVCVLLAVCRFCEDLLPGSLGGPGALDGLPALFSKPFSFENPADWLADLQKGVSFYFTNDCAEAAQNLSYKCMETFMLPPPALVDALSYAHGRFQRDCAAPGARWIFTTGHPNEQDLLHRLAPLFEHCGGFREIRAALPPPLALFEYEAFLNALCKSLLQTVPVDLVDWPGKGGDGPGYTLSTPGLSAKGDTP